MTLERRIRGEIEGRIRSGEWRPGHRIPFEHELVAYYGCSRATVSKAIAVLVRDGLIERRRKAGSFVAHPHVRSAVLEVPDLALAIAARGEAYRWTMAARRMVPAGEPPLTDLIMGPALAIDGVHWSGDAPFAHEHRLIALDVVPEAADTDFASLAPGTWLLAHVPWTEARHRIAAIGATRAVAKSLAIKPGTPCLQIERWTWRGSAPVTFVRQVFPGDRYDLMADFTPGR